MDTNKKLSFQDEMEREAKKIEEELNAHPELKDLTVSKEFDDALCKQIRAYENGKKKNESRIKGRCVKFPHNKKFLVTFVAMVTLMCAMGATGIGSKSYKKEVEHAVYGTQKMQKVNVDDMEKQESTAEGEIFAFQEVEKKIGIIPVRFTYKPKKMEFLRYQLDQKEQRAKLFYTYKGNVIRYDIYKNESNSSLGQNQEDSLIKETTVKTGDQVTSIRQYEINATHEKYKVLSFKYKDVNYQLKGKIEKDEIKKIAKNLKFL